KGDRWPIIGSRPRSNRRARWRCTTGARASGSSTCCAWRTAATRATPTRTVRRHGIASCAPRGRSGFVDWRRGRWSQRWKRLSGCAPGTAADGRRGLALLAPGFFEYEWTSRGDLIMTLLRAVGELSRGDLPTRPGHAGWPTATPLAQCLGPCRVELALAPVPQAEVERGDV